MLYLKFIVRAVYVYALASERKENCATWKCGNEIFFVFFW